MTEDQHNAIPEIPEQKEPGSFRLIMALGIAGFLAGIILVGTFIYTDPLIEANKAAAIQRAIFKVLPECSSFQSLYLENGQLIVKDIEAGNKEEADRDDLLIYAGFNTNEELVGFAVPGSEPGFQDIIATLFGYDGSKKVIIGFEVLESKETPGLGDKIFKDAGFQTNFTSLATEPEIVPVKKGAKQNSNEVETITGATISSKAVVRSLNKSMDIWRSPIDEYLRINNIKTAVKQE